MSFSKSVETEALARRIEITDDNLIVELRDGRRISIPLEWYPRLQHAASDELLNWELLGEGKGIHWPELDEDISVEGVLAGRRSMESEASLNEWRKNRP
ncbi:MAG: DUF2442 domain-containing protein [Puniceicoccaceae bacterium]